MAKRGRPRDFEREEALQRAMELFWDRGYEATTLADLQKVMGNITAPSFYAAFGSKEQVFKEAVELYCRTEGSPLMQALEEGKTARESIGGMLSAALVSFSQPGKPRGCMLVQGAMNTASENQGIQEYARCHRGQTVKMFRKRLEKGVADGDVPGGVDLTAAATFYSTFIQGLSIQARDGASVKALKAATDGAMAAWDALTAPRRQA